MTGGEGGRERRLAGDHLQTLAGEPRPTGGDAIARSRSYCAGVLEALGFGIVARQFEYSAFVGVYGTPLGGAVVLLMLCASAGAAARSRNMLAFAIVVLALPVLGAGGWWLGRRGVLALPVMRRRGVNLEAVRGSEKPELWLVAHLDSKSQAVPLLLRAAGIVTLGAAWVAALVMTALAAAGVSVDGWRLLIGVAAVGAAPVLASIVGPHSAGAVDNAAGVATVLTAAALLPPHVPLGVLLTDAEELGLAGSRAWCRERHVKAGIALNCDGVDDVGILTLMWTRPRAPRLERALREAALREGDNLRVIPLIAGVLVDAVALSDCGWEVVTLSRGTISTLRRIHTRRDDRTQLSGSGVAIAARTLARATSEISRND